MVSNHGHENSIHLLDRLEVLNTAITKSLYIIIKRDICIIENILNTTINYKININHGRHQGRREAINIGGGGGGGRHVLTNIS